MQNPPNKRISFLGGLKGWLAVLIVIFHYSAAFFPYGYVLWGSGLTGEAQYEWYVLNFPLSLFFQTAYLPLFYAMIAYIPAIKIFRDSDTLFIQRQALGRYFRLMPPVLVTALFSYAVFAFGFSEHVQISELIDNEWIKSSCYYAEHSWLGALKNGVWETFTTDGAGGYCSVLWCVNQIFVGSYLTYGFLLMFRNVKNRLPLYIACYLILLKYPAYCGFLSGIAAADIYAYARPELMKKLAVPSIFLVLFLMILPEPMFPGWFMNLYREGIASFFLLCAVPYLPHLNKYLSGNVINWLGKRSFSIILTHFPIMLSVSAWVFEKAYPARVPQFLCMLAALLAGTPLILLASEIMYRFVEIPAGRFTKWFTGKWIRAD